ncbi:hypothetical protein L2E82_13635 [Cichorium intybus]|uniref:Uncharacterized protein n=1 Tax=Cichorium intybus TaxID=13427 RepID=A0ACB9EY59_CICIN|nr:hypothetical protein L2E82_13635 [Cichorium intybus]
MVKTGLIEKLVRAMVLAMVVGVVTAKGHNSGDVKGSNLMGYGKFREELKRWKIEADTRFIEKIKRLKVY